jgi:hypothetical protein
MLPGLGIGHVVPIEIEDVLVSRPPLQHRNEHTNIQVEPHGPSYMNKRIDMSNLAPSPFLDLLPRRFPRGGMREETYMPMYTAR